MYVVRDLETKETTLKAICDECGIPITNDDHYRVIGKYDEAYDVYEEYAVHIECPKVYEGKPKGDNNWIIT